MADFNKIKIEPKENGYIITVIEPSQDNGKEFVFNDMDSMKKWLKENLSLVGELARFSDALDNENVEEDVNYYGSTFSIPATGWYPNNHIITTTPIGV